MEFKFEQPHTEGGERDKKIFPYESNTGIIIFLVSWAGGGVLSKK